MHITTAAPAEWSAAFELALEHLPGDVRSVRVLNALALVASGDIDPAGIFVARHTAGLCGVAVCVLLRGASGLFWLPKTVPADPALEDQLVDRALDWLRRRGAKLAQAFFGPLDRPYACALLRRGFEQVTRLNYMEHLLQDLPSSSAPDIRYLTYSEKNQDLFHATLLNTYEATLDCPELNGVRTIEEIIAGHQGQGNHHPDRWWLALANGRAVGVAMTTVVPDLEAWDLSYLGVVPEARRRGVGRALTGHVLEAAQQARAPKLILAVDERNLPAAQLYGQLGFTSIDFREVYLHIFDRSLAARSVSNPATVI
jgi:ribosomal protein S18 acetylase RimI-like enzyme